VEEEDPQDQPHVVLNSDEEVGDGDGDGPDEHLLSKAEATLRRQVGAIVEKTAAGEENFVWRDVPAVTTHTRKERLAYFREKGVGLKGGIPTSNDGDVDLLSLWLHLYPGKIEDDLRRLNEEGFLEKRQVGSLSPDTNGLFLLELSTQLDSSTKQGRGYGHVRRHE
jgi:hypothetical protein